ncbi:MAG TPA: DUF3501 family protein [Polyangiaceae bacterium]
MKPVERAEVLDLESYEQVREPFRRRIMAEKRVRRVPLGNHMTVLFENHDSVLFQIQEMLRTERISRELAIHHEIDTYNALVPGPNQLSATVFIEYPDHIERDQMLERLVGVEGGFYLLAAGERQAAIGEKRGERTDRTTAVQYIRFSLSERAARAIRKGDPLSLGVDHPSYSAEVELSPATVQSLAADLND